MKTLFFAIAVVSGLFACNNFNSPDVKEFIPGTYTSVFHDSISPTANVQGSDQLVISKQAESGSDAYQILRTIKYQKTLDNVKQGEETKTETWIGFYDSEHKVIKTQTEKILAFDVQNQNVIIGDKKYKKVG